MSPLSDTIEQCEGWDNPTPHRRHLGDDRMERTRAIPGKVYAKVIVAISMIVLWSLSAASGVVAWFAPRGPRSGWTALLFNMTKRDWIDLHFWLSVAAVLVTLVHIVLDWRPLVGYIRCITRVRHISPKE